MTYITSQKKLAEAVECGEVHLSRIKKRQRGVSEQLAEKLEDVTGIKQMTWAVGNRRTLAKQLRDFFEEQRMLKRINASKGRG